MLKGIVNGVEKDIIRIPMIGDAPTTVTGINSVTFETEATSVIGCEIEGNTQQTGTPSPDNIIMPTFCGERTGNLFDAATAYGNLYNNGVVSGTTYDMYSISNYFDESQVGKQLTISIRADKVTATRIYISAYIAGSNIDSNSIYAGNTGVMSVTITPQSINDRWRIKYGSNPYNECVISNIMLNSGSTALPYEPYGYKIPITCAGQTVPVYLGQTQTVRRIKKLVLTGREAFTKNNGQIDNYLYYANKGDILPGSIDKPPVLCNELPVKDSAPQTDIGINTNNNFSVVYFNFGADVMDAQPSGKRLKEYLAAQYAAGTPVTVWYVLAEPETAIVNEPLAKIGDYADELHSEDAGVTIPTTKGQNTLSIETTLSPSSTEVTYLGIKNAYKEGWEVRDNQDRLIWGYNSTISGVPPLTFKGGGTPLISWSMLGNAQQTGTPSPDNIIMPTFCGERTANLMFSDRTARYTSANIAIDQTQGSAEFTISRTETENDGSTTVNMSLSLKAGTYTLSVDGMNAFDRKLDRIYLRNENGDVLVNDVQTGIPKTFTLMEDTFVNRLSFVFDARSTYSNQIVRIMLNTGSTALPYEPYGWKVPITCAGQTTPVYLGQTQTVRRIKKLVLDGDETGWRYSSASSRDRAELANAAKKMTDTVAISTHYPYEVGTSYPLVGNFTINTIGTLYIGIESGTFETFKAYLQQQYANGTPVTVWYVLANEQTGIINEPLAKIGDYADELHSEDAGVSIPTAKGSNTLTVNTTLAPSDVSITGHIKSTS